MRALPLRNRPPTLLHAPHPRQPQLRGRSRSGGQLPAPQHGHGSRNGRFPARGDAADHLPPRLPRRCGATTAANTSLMGRWQKLGEQPLTVCDTGHNPHGIAYVARQLKATPHKTTLLRDRLRPRQGPRPYPPPAAARRPLYLHAGEDRTGLLCPPSLPPKPRSTGCTARPSPKFPPQSPAPRSWPAPTT